jgi:hypothetical protein
LSPAVCFVFPASTEKEEAKFYPVVCVVAAAISELLLRYVGQRLEWRMQQQQQQCE